MLRQLHRLSNWIRMHIAWGLYWLGDLVCPPFEYFPEAQFDIEAEINSILASIDSDPEPSYSWVYNEAGDLVTTNSPYQWVTGTEGDDKDDWQVNQDAKEPGRL